MEDAAGTRASIKSIRNYDPLKSIELAQKQVMIVAT